MNARSFFKKKIKVRCPDAKLFVAAACVFFGISYLGCTHGNEEAQKTAPSASPAATHPQPSPTVPQTSENASQGTSALPGKKPLTEVTQYPIETSTAAKQSAAKSNKKPGEQQAAPKQSSSPPAASAAAEQSAVSSGKKSEEQKPVSPGISKNTPPAETATAPHTEKTTSPAPPPSLRTGTVDAARLNVRQQPDPTAAKLATMSRGTEVKISAEKGEWYRITADNGLLKGWVAKRYIHVTPAGESASKASIERRPFNAS
jgi:hypothetical protein